MYKLFVCLICFLTAFPAFAADEKLRDPTMPLGQSSKVSQANPAQEVLQLNSILIGQQRRIAVINGQSVRQGDSIKGTGFRVTSIQSNSVTVQSHQATRVLSLVDTKVKK